MVAGTGQNFRALEHLREGDVLVVWKLDRLSRSLKDLLHIMERVREAGAGFRSLTEAVDTTTAAGRMMMQMLGSFAEFERSMVRERTGPAWLPPAIAAPRWGGRQSSARTNSKKSSGPFAMAPRQPRMQPGSSGSIARALPACWRARRSRTWRQGQRPGINARKKLKDKKRARRFSSQALQR